MNKTYIFYHLITILHIFLLGSCSLFPLQPNAEPKSKETALTATIEPAFDQSATAANTIEPLIPSPTLEPTPTPMPTIIRTWGDYPGPTIYPPIEIPPPMPLLEKPYSQTNILLLGDDQRPYESGLRTDSILLVSIDTEKNLVNLVSFPRDLYVYAPGWTMQRINVVYERGGFELLALTFAYNFGIQLDYYIRINIFTLENLIDQLGGIDVNVAYPMSDYDPLLHGTRSIPAGKIRMNGAVAVWYCRARSATSDFDRARRHQEVLLALFQRVVSFDLVHEAPNLYRQFSSSVSTNMTFENIARFIPFALKNKQQLPLRQFLIGKAYVTEWTVPTDGSKVLLPKRDPVRLLMLQAFES